MGKYLKLFDTHTQYESYTADTQNFILPNVSYCEDQANVVHYNPYVPYDPYNGHEYVDLGLPSGTKWATMNVGATGVTDYGYYYQYGKGDAQYTATSGDSDYSGTENPLALSADTAAIVMGGDWHMPTSAQCAELIANTDYTWATIDGVNGGKFANKTDATKYVFLPAAGNWVGGSQNDAGSKGTYWISTPNNSSRAYNLFLINGRKQMYNDAWRFYGYSVRGVVG